MPNRTFIELKQSNSYQTYQFYATMSNKNTTLTDGLKIAALTTLSWIRERLGEIKFESLNTVNVDEYKKFKIENYKDVHIDDGYKIDIVNDFCNGVFAVKIVEPDLGALSDGVNCISPVAGRLIQSDIGYRIIDNRLECGFKTTISDLADSEKADCYRFSIIKKLYNNPNFGLTHIIDVAKGCEIVNNKESFDFITNSHESSSNQMPLALYIADIDEKECSKKDVNIFEARNIDININTSFEHQKRITKKLELDNAITATNEVLSKALKSKYSLFGYCQFVIVLSDGLELVKKKYKFRNLKRNDVIIIEPKCYGGEVRLAQYNDDIVKYLRNYTRDKTYNFNNVLFFNSAYIEKIRYQQIYTEEIGQKLNEVSRERDNLKNKLDKANLKSTYSSNDKNEDLKERIDYLLRIYDDLKTQSDKKDKEIIQHKQLIQEQKRIIEYYNRKNTRPKSHKEIIGWCEKYFRNKVEFNVKAIDCLNLNSATNVSVDSICDAIDFLATIYYENHFYELSYDAMLHYCSRIYNRVFDVSPSGIKQTDSSKCKIRYALNDEKKKEIVLDYHLKVGGSRDQDLLRIYFIHDEYKKTVIIGSLPNHLDY